MKHLPKIIILIIGCIVCWWIGARIPLASVLPIAFMVMGMAIGAVATAIAVSAPKERSTTQQSQPTALTVQPERWFVVEPTVMILPTATHGKFGVKR